MSPKFPKMNAADQVFELPQKQDIGYARLLFEDRRERHIFCRCGCFEIQRRDEIVNEDVGNDVQAL